MAMTDAQLEVFLGIGRLSWPQRTKIMLRITPAQRALYDRMANVETEVELWRSGLGPKPRGVILCGSGR
jgi:hypothetical protein